VTSVKCTDGKSARQAFGPNPALSDRSKIIHVTCDRRFPSHFASLVVGESQCHAKASATLGFCMGKFLIFAMENKGHFGG
jgi:hypothetical protein